MLREKQERHKSAKKSAEPGEPEPANQQGGIGNQLSRTLQNVIEARSYQAGKPGDANNEEPFVMMAGLTAALQVAALQELLAATVKVCLQKVRRGQQSRGDHQAKRRNCERPKVEKRNHRWLSSSPSKVYTRARSSSNFAF